MKLFNAYSPFAKAIAALTLFTGIGFASHAAAQDKQLVIGVTSGPHAQITEAAKKVAEKEGLPVKIVEFNDFIQPNAALDHGELDINIYQHKPFLDAQNKARGYHIVPVAKAVLQLMGVYSKQYKALKDLPVGAKVAIPNDPSNGARALLVLQSAGLITLKAGVTTTASVFDIADNPKKIKVVEIDAAQIVHSLNDVDAAAINSNYALQAGLNPAKDTIFLEPKNADFAVILIAARENNKNDPRIARFIKAYQSDEVKAFIEKTFPGAYFPAW